MSDKILVISDKQKEYGWTMILKTPFSVMILRLFLPMSIWPETGLSTGSGFFRPTTPSPV